MPLVASKVTPELTVRLVPGSTVTVLQVTLELITASPDSMMILSLAVAFVLGSLGDQLPLKVNTVGVVVTVTSTSSKPSEPPFMSKVNPTIIALIPVTSIVVGPIAKDPV